MKILGREIRWSDPTPQLETRTLEQITLSDIGLAFTATQAEILGAGRSSIPAVYRAIQLISDITASLPMEAIDRRGIAIPFTPQLLTQPDPTTTYHSTIRKIVASLLLRGNAYLWPRTRDKAQQIQSLYVLNPDEVSVAWDRANLYPEYVWRDKPMAPLKEIFPITLNQWPGNLTGIGPIEAARVMLTGVLYEQNLSRRLVEDEATPSGTLNIPRQLSKAEAEEVQEMWEESHGGRKRPAVLSGGVEFKPITLSPVDAQFIEQRNFSIQEIGRLFGLDGYFLLVESGGSLTYSTTESLFRQFLTMTLAPSYLEPIEQTFSLMLPEGESARFKTTEILQADTLSRYQANEIAIRSGFKTIDEIRAEEHLPRIEPATRPQAQEAPNATG